MNYPGSLIKEGTQSDAVKAIQQQLSDAGFGHLTIDGNFGPGTLAAVQAFQTAKGLQPDGVVGPGTWSTLFPPAPAQAQPAAGGDRDSFFQAITATLFNGTMKQTQKDGINVILDEWDANYSGTDSRFLAYMFATVFHETAKTMQPIAEFGKGAGQKYGIPDATTGQTYYGRGFVQLTWKVNYVEFGKILAVDLVNNPDLAMEMSTATKIMFIGMTKGSFTGVKLANYFNDTTADWVNARKIINRLDKADLVASYGTKFFSALFPAVV